VSAILVADLTGFSALMALDDEGTARAVRRVQAFVREIVAACEGRAEAVAGDSILAHFQSIAAAVDAALRIHRGLATEDFGERRLQMRIGVHYGDVLLSAEGLAFGDAVNVAARLMALARPGTICISEGVYRLVRTKCDEPFEDLGSQRLKNISDRVHAYLIVPRGTLAPPAEPRARRWTRTAIAAGALGLAALAAVLLVRPVRPPTAADRPNAAPAPAALTLGVMLFKSPGDDAEHAWMGEALRDELNTELSGLAHVKVYSREFIDFLIRRQNLTEIEVATKLGITQMLSGSVVAKSGTIRVETHVVNVTTGVLEASYTTVGREQDFLDVEDRMVQGVIGHLNLELDDEDRRRLAARRTTDVDALKLLLEAERGGAANPPPAPPAPGSRLERWLGRLAPLPAWAEDDPAGARAAIIAVLERYRRATEARAVGDLAAVYATFPPEQQAAQQRYFDNVTALRVAIDNVDVVVVGDEAVVSYTRTDDFADARTGRPMHVSVRLTKTMRRDAGAWKIVPGV
jgi:adenylate cyclase